jgi:hypothetical protein
VNNALSVNLYAPTCGILLVYLGKTPQVGIILKRLLLSLK